MCHLLLQQGWGCCCCRLMRLVLAYLPAQLLTFPAAASAPGLSSVRTAAYTITQ
jgi:hypothetical protein